MPQLRSWCAKHARVAHAININIIFNYCTRLRVAVAIVYVCCNCMLLKLLVLCMVLNAFVYVYTHVHTCTSYMWPWVHVCTYVCIPHSRAEMHLNGRRQPFNGCSPSPGQLSERSSALVGRGPFSHVPPRGHVHFSAQLQWF